MYAGIPSQTEWYVPVEQDTLDRRVIGLTSASKTQNHLRFRVATVRIALLTMDYMHAVAKQTMAGTTATLPIIMVSRRVWQRMNVQKVILLVTPALYV